MTQVEAIKEMMKQAGTNGVKLSEEMGYASKTTLSVMMQRKNMTVDVLLEIADLCGYKVTLTKKNKGDKIRQPIDLELDPTKERTNHRSNRS